MPLYLPASAFLGPQLLAYELPIMGDSLETLLLELAKELSQVFLVESADPEFFCELWVDTYLFENVLKVLLNSHEGGSALF